MFVCTGNICRSPFGEIFLADRFEKISPGQFSVSSSGTLGMVGYPFAPMANEVAKSYGVYVDNFKPRRLTEGMIDENHLILALGQEHRKKIISLEPRAIKKTFTLREFVRCLELINISLILKKSYKCKTNFDAWNALINEAHMQRFKCIEDKKEDDIIDPWMQEMESYKKMADGILVCINFLSEIQHKIQLHIS